MNYVAGVTLLPGSVVSPTAVTTLLVLAIGAVVYVIYTRGESNMPAKLQYSQVPPQSGGLQLFDFFANVDVDCGTYSLH